MIHPNAFRCPECGIAARQDDRTTSTKQQTIRKISYDCGTQLVITNDNLQYKSKIIASTKCLEYRVLSEG